MKKFFLIVAVIASVMFVGCSSDSENGADVVSAEGLNGTSWSAEWSEDYDFNGHEYKDVHTNSITFSTTICSVTYKTDTYEDGQFYDTISGDYDVIYEASNFPTVQLIDGDLYIRTITVSDNSFTYLGGTYYKK